MNALGINDIITTKLTKGFIQLEETNETFRRNDNSPRQGGSFTAAAVVATLFMGRRSIGELPNFYFSIRDIWKNISELDFQYSAAIIFSTSGNPGDITKSLASIITARLFLVII
jgi:hypothetical protein